MPAGDTELEITFSGSNNFFVTSSPEGNVYVYIEVAVNPEFGLRNATFKLYETGEAVEGRYLGSVSDGRTAKHLYWTNIYEGLSDERGQLRESDDVPEVPASWGSEPGDGTSGQSEDL